MEKVIDLRFDTTTENKRFSYSNDNKTVKKVKREGYWDGLLLANTFADLMETSEDGLKRQAKFKISIDDLLHEDTCRIMIGFAADSTQSEGVWNQETIWSFDASNNSFYQFKVLGEYTECEELPLQQGDTVEFIMDVGKNRCLYAHIESKRLPQPVEFKAKLFMKFKDEDLPKIRPCLFIYDMGVTISLLDN